MRITLATWLTLSRFFAAPCVAYYIICSWWLAAFILVLCAALTDTLDGYLARRAGQETVIGAYLDPLADKIFLVSCYSALLYVFGIQTGMLAGLACFVILRESILIIGTLYLMYTHYGRPLSSLVIRPTQWGKLATVMHCTVLSVVLLQYAELITLPSTLLNTMVIITMAFMVTSATQYGILWTKKMAVIALIGCTLSCLNAHDFVIDRPSTTSSERHKLRDTLTQLFGDYLELLVGNFMLIAQKKNFDNVTYVHHLRNVEHFLHYGTWRDVHSEESCLNVIEYIARVQKELLRTFRNLLERSTDSCFVTCKTKVQLERYVEYTREMIKTEKKYYRELTEHVA